MVLLRQSVDSSAHVDGIDPEGDSAMQNHAFWGEKDKPSKHTYITLRFMVKLYASLLFAEREYASAHLRPPLLCFGPLDSLLKARRRHRRGFTFARPICILYAPAQENDPPS